MPREIKTKKSFGSVRVAKFSPPLPEGLPTLLNLQITFEEAMRLHLGIGQVLAKLNAYDRGKKAGKRTCLNLGLHVRNQRIWITEDMLPPQPAAAAEADAPQ